MDKKKKRLDKRTVGIVLLIELGVLILLALTALLLIKIEKDRLMPGHAGTGQTYAPQQTPEPTPLPNFHAPAADPDLDAMGLLESVREEHANELSALYWVDITPEGMEGYTLLRHVSLGISCLVCPDGRSVRLGEESEGCGAVSALYLDLDGNEENELLYTYTVTGENGTDCALGWLSPGNGSEVTAPFRLTKGTWALRSDDGRAILYKASLASTDSAGYYELIPGDDVGEVIEQEGGLALLVH